MEIYFLEWLIFVSSVQWIAELFRSTEHYVEILQHITVCA